VPEACRTDKGSPASCVWLGVKTARPRFGLAMPRRSRRTIKTMARPYGKTSRPRSASRKRKPSGSDAVKYHIRLPGAEAMTIPEAQQGFYDLVKYILPQSPYLKIAKLDVYVRYEDHLGRPASPGEDEVTIIPYQSSADEFGI